MSDRDHTELIARFTAWVEARRIAGGAVPDYTDQALFEKVAEALASSAPAPPATEPMYDYAPYPPAVRALQRRPVSADHAELVARVRKLVAKRGGPFQNIPLAARIVTKLADACEALASSTPALPADQMLMPISDVNDLDAVVHELGIEDSDTTPAEAVRALRAQILAPPAGGFETTEEERAELKQITEMQAYYGRISTGAVSVDLMLRLLRDFDRVLSARSSKDT